MAALLEPDDLRLAARVCVEALAPAVEHDWSVRAGELEWDASATLDHLLDGLGYYAVHLAVRATSHLPFETGSIVPVQARTPAAGLAALEALAAMLADVVRAAPPTARAYHGWGRADPEAFVAMGCDEMLIHTADIAQGLGVPFRPPEELAARVLARLFPWAPSVDEGEAWAALLWANGRTALPDRPRLGSEWRWWSAPLEEWDDQEPIVPSAV